VRFRRDRGEARGLSVSEPARRDPLAGALEVGLFVLILAVPLPFGAVGPGGRLLLEVAASLLGAIWLLRSAMRGTPGPSKAARAGIVFLVLLAALQILPLGADLVSAVSPRSMELRAATVPTGDALEAERRLLETDPATLVPRPTISVDPGSTASALRTGAALAVLLLVAATVAATRGVKRLALALLVSASFQGLYGLLVLASGHDRIWHVPKRAYLDAATGTFVNKNHFACFLAVSLTCGMALILRNAGRRRSGAAVHRLAALFSSEGSRNLILGVLLVLGLAGLLASFSRAGIALGLAALLATITAAGRFLRVRTRLIVALVIVSLALVPLSRIGPERLVQRFADSSESLTSPGGRLRVWLDSLEMIAAYPAAGSGYGTFAAAYPLHRSPEVRLYYAHAHNDLIQVVVEGGLVGAAALLLLLVPVGRAVGAGIRGTKGTLGVGFAAGLAAMLLHGLVDFNFHIPANAAVAAIVAGALMGLPCRRR
jgi:O-antigen ligase